MPKSLLLLICIQSVVNALDSTLENQECSALLQTELQKQSKEHVGPTKIPCVIHQTWRNHKILGKHKGWSKSWSKMNPTCEHRIWTDADLDELVRTKSPDLIAPIWDGLTKIQRADVFRYLVLWVHGGYYADLDVASVKPIRDYEVPKEANMIVGYEVGHRFPEEARIDNALARSEQFENWFFASAPNNPVLYRSLEMVREKFGWKVQNTLDLTGPGTFSDAIHEFLERSQSKAIAKEVSFRQTKAEFRRDSHYLSYPSEALYGTGEWKLWILAAGRVNQQPQVKEADPKEVYEPIIHHYFEGTWKPAHGGKLRV
eukprot:symbB.v1.2.009943.t1/scaffold642.1/size177528/6